MSATVFIIAKIRRAQCDVILKKIFDLVNQQRCDGYIIRNDLLYKENADDVQLVLPKSTQTQIVRQIHGSFFGSEN